MQNENTLHGDFEMSSLSQDEVCAAVLLVISRAVYVVQDRLYGVILKTLR